MENSQPGQCANSLITILANAPRASDPLISVPATSKASGIPKCEARPSGQRTIVARFVATLGSQRAPTRIS